MTDTTEAPYSIPYLEPSEPADIPYAGQIMAERVTAVFKDMPYGKMWKTADQAYTAAAPAVVQMTGNRVTGGMVFSDATDTLTVPIAGLYRIDFGVYWSAAAASYLAARPTRGGVQLDYVQIATSSADMVIRGSHEVNLAAGDVLALTAAAGVNGTIKGTGGENATSWLSARWMRPVL